jgi:hypothetical protein
MINVPLLAASAEQPRVVFVASDEAGLRLIHAVRRSAGDWSTTVVRRVSSQVSIHVLAMLKAPPGVVLPLHHLVIARRPR